MPILMFLAAVWSGFLATNSRSRPVPFRFWVWILVVVVRGWAREREMLAPLSSLSASTFISRTENPSSPRGIWYLFSSFSSVMAIGEGTSSMHVGERGWLTLR